MVLLATQILWVCATLYCNSYEPIATLHIYDGEAFKHCLEYNSLACTKWTGKHYSKIDIFINSSDHMSKREKNWVDCKGRNLLEHEIWRAKELLELPC